MPPTPGPPTLALDVGGLAPDAATVDVLARLQLGARRQGCRIALEGASRDLLELVAFMGLADVLSANETAVQREVSDGAWREIISG
jgi:ABC-type transporter Mla MlaB component